LGVENLADAVACCLKAEPQGCGIYLLRDEEDVSTPRLIRLLSQGLDKRVLLLPVPLALLRLAGRLLGKGPAVDRLLGSLQVDDSAFRARFGWTPPHRLEDGLRSMAKSFRLTSTQI